MRECGVSVHKWPVVHRHMDCAIAVHLRVVQFHLILETVRMLMCANGVVENSLVVLLSLPLLARLGPSTVVSASSLDQCGHCWRFCLSWCFVQCCYWCVPFHLERFIVSFGWAIYPAAYFIDEMKGADGAVGILHEPVHPRCALQLRVDQLLH